MTGSWKRGVEIFVSKSGKMKGFASLGKSKKQESGTLDYSRNGNGNGGPVVPAAGTSVSPKVNRKVAVKAPKDESSGKQGIMSKITSRANLRSKRTNSEKNGGGVTVPPVVSGSKSDQEMEKAFKVYDADKDGRISLAELSSVLTSLCGAISEQEIVQIMEEVDTDNDGFISLAEFVAFHTSSKPGVLNGEISPDMDPMRDAFQMFDKDGDSRISANELQSVLVSLGDKGHSIEECRQMINSVDKDGDGHVDFQEFLELMGC